MTTMDHVRFLWSHLYVQCVWMPFLTLYTLISGETSAYTGVRHITNFHAVKLLRPKNTHKIEPGCVYLCNHRSWADFFLDQTLCGGAAYLSRKMVILATPMSSLWAWLGHSTWFFNRKKGADRTKLFEWIDAQWEKRPEFGLIAYPEGTRNRTKEPLPLKTGVLEYAYRYKRNIQIVITTNKEKVVNEKQARIKFGVFCLSHASSVISPDDFDSFDEFKKEIRERFALHWEETYKIESNLDSLIKKGEVVELNPPYGPSDASLEFKDVPVMQRVWILRLVLTLISLIYSAARYVKH